MVDNLVNRWNRKSAPTIQFQNLPDQITEKVKPEREIQLMMITSHSTIVNCMHQGYSAKVWEEKEEKR
jgi:hypothetical protein